ncbi:type 1 glutamine amidotransferase domain-containing protein [Tahibacter amnicola]|uniref:Type 1 glutamine amidotransferase domain-containing protein n=1 Tax=Tahibacter amnicola TaxID=2976241 RepID=A0ABY6BK13_9GAMM|nr:type 1 glutamine amidotransferase domain-containing protein [Tahibacter amnicola]UXI68936.1 type 1 glutamine amidotransferase domain-containing protein [Tahibacter amnicola]
MPVSRIIRSFLALLLSAWLGAVPSVHAAPGNDKTDPTAPENPGRILFILASSKVHGRSTIPASISFGEVVNAWDTFQAAGYPVDFVSPDGGEVPILDTYVGKEMEPRLKDDRIMNGLRNTATPAQVDPARYRAVYYVGGSNAMYGVPEHPVLQKIAMHVYERNGGVISAVCHGTAGIVHLTLASGQALVAGRRITGYPEEHEKQDAPYFKQLPFLMRKTVEARGGFFHAVDGQQPYVEVDGRVVTGQNYASATQVAQAVVELLAGRTAQPPRRDPKTA